MWFVFKVVYNLSKGLSEIDMLRPWLLNIAAKTPKCPVIVVGTHSDKVPSGGYILVLFLL